MYSETCLWVVWDGPPQSLTSHIFFTLDHSQLDKEVAGKTKVQTFLLSDQENRHNLDPGPAQLHVSFIQHTHDRPAVGGGIIPLITG